MLTSKLAADVPLVLPNVIVPLPKAPAEVSPMTVPASMTRPPVKVLAPLNTVVPPVVCVATTPDPAKMAVMVPLSKA